MREILFKAKRVDNGEWVEGELVTNKPSHSYRIITNFGLCVDGKYAGNNLHHISGEIHLVHPKTVCQYTGLKDKNGNNIFEGDLITYRETFELPLTETVEWKGSHYSFDGDLLYDWNDLIEITGNRHD